MAILDPSYISPGGVVAGTAVTPEMPIRCRTDRGQLRTEGCQDE